MLHVDLVLAIPLFRGGRGGEQHSAGVCCKQMYSPEFVSTDPAEEVELVVDLMAIRAQECNEAIWCPDLVCVDLLEDTLSAQVTDDLLVNRGKRKRHEISFCVVEELSSICDSAHVSEGAL